MDAGERVLALWDGSHEAFREVSSQDGWLDFKTQISSPSHPRRQKLVVSGRRNQLLARFTLD